MYTNVKHLLLHLRRTENILAFQTKSKANTGIVATPKIRVCWYQMRDCDRSRHCYRKQWGKVEEALSRDAQGQAPPPSGKDQSGRTRQEAADKGFFEGSGVDFLWFSFLTQSKHHFKFLQTAKCECQKGNFNCTKLLTKYKMAIECTHRFPTSNLHNKIDLALTLRGILTMVPCPPPPFLTSPDWPCGRGQQVGLGGRGG